MSSDVPPKVEVGKPKPTAQSKTKGDVGKTTSPVEATIDQTVAAQSGSGAVPARISSGPGTAKNVSSRTPDPEQNRGNAPSDDVSDDVSDNRVDGALGPPPSRLGGYRIIRMLGRGAMGAVYQAKQVSLDRDVALKTIRGRLADNPASLARFTREAYAAAQLSHHNVVQIYDFGEDDGQHFFSMEWIRGGSLGDLVREKGAIDPKLAATYILQAARGLQFAHQCGMVHRDVKPANLLLSEEGVVKVADLGLVKVPDQVDTEPSGATLSRSGLQSGTQVTMQGTAVGTPAYMAPEQSNDASTVDHRADIYSLGCSLFYLLAGQSPYSGSVASEVMEQHARAPLPNLVEINSRVPVSLQQIVSRSMAKRPSDRYGSLAEMIHDLQDFLGVESLSGFSPSSDQADRWEAIASSYRKSQTIKRLSGSLLMILAAVSLLTLLVSPFVSLYAALAGPAIFVFGCGTAIALGATNARSAVADHARRWLGTLSWFELAGGIVAALLILVVLLLSGLWIGVLIGAGLGIAAGAAYHFGVAVVAEKAGESALEDARKLVRDLRILGAEEEGLRDFLARYAGKGWQVIYEALFGYEALIDARHRLALDPSFQGSVNDRSIRDRVCMMLDSKAKANREAVDRKKLAKLEQRSLISQGATESQAREQSWQMASAIMETAQVVVDKSVSDERQIAEAKRKRIKAMLADARSGNYRRSRDRFAAIKLALSGFSRLLAGCLLLAAFAFAGQSTGLFSHELVESVRSGEIDLNSFDEDATTDALGGDTSVWSLGIAGFLLCISAFVSGWRMTPFALVATLAILFGAEWGVPAVGPAKAWMVAAVAGLAVYLPGFVFGESRH